MKKTLPAPNEPEPWITQVRDFLWRHAAIETIAIWIVVGVALSAAIVVYLIANEAIDIASRTLGVG